MEVDSEVQEEMHFEESFVDDDRTTSYARHRFVTKEMNIQCALKFPC